jgi:ATP-dependent Clp protease ATP-binding subunit ClpA
VEVAKHAVEQQLAMMQRECEEAKAKAEKASLALDKLRADTDQQLQQLKHQHARALKNAQQELQEKVCGLSQALEHVEGELKAAQQQLHASEITSATNTEKGTNHDRESLEQALSAAQSKVHEMELAHARALKNAQQELQEKVCGLSQALEHVEGELKAGHDLLNYASNGAFSSFLLWMPMVVQMHCSNVGRDMCTLCTGRLLELLKERGITDEELQLISAQPRLQVFLASLLIKAIDQVLGCNPINSDCM